MSYVNAGQTLPEHLIEEIQSYVDGVYLYIPRKAENKKQWGTESRSRQTLLERDRSIFDAYCAGCRVAELARVYFLSEKTIQRIVRRQKRLRGCACESGEAR
ncbi:MAG: CD3324 family protein [Eubacteriales bacterium]|nr:CD3324 family protein [Eubacteriales bacterium]